MTSEGGAGDVEVAGGGKGGSAAGGSSGGMSSTGGTDGVAGSSAGSAGAAGTAGSAGATSTGATLLISEVKTRGVAGGSDEFVELYNPGSTAVSFDNTWTLRARAAIVNTCSSGVYSTRFVGKGQSIPGHGHFLITGAGYAGSVTADGALTIAITDGGSIVLTHGAQTVDAVCYAFDGATKAEISGSNKYEGEGPPLSNLPHNNNGGPISNTDSSLERKPGGGAGNAQDTDKNELDFSAATPTTPQNTDSAKVP